jgi:predicted nicotinamide N-methyase
MMSHHCCTVGLESIASPTLFQRFLSIVHDLPQLYQKPNPDVLLDALNLLAITPSTFASAKEMAKGGSQVSGQGVPRYLTSIVSSSLLWIEDDETKDEIWSLASTRLSERSGRNAMPAITRSFEIDDTINVQLQEPTLTEDKLGLKTWTSSLLLSRRLHDLRKRLPQHLDKVLELGAGTGLVGISAACLWKTHIVLTDLPEIVPNLQHNLELNRGLITTNNGYVEAQTLDWSDETNAPRSEEEKVMVILAADPIYSPDHPRLLVSAMTRWISRRCEARFIVELPVRDRYAKERQGLRDLLAGEHFVVVEEGTEVGYDDWQRRDGSPAEVECWWSVWRPE